MSCSMATCLVLSSVCTANTKRPVSSNSAICRYNSNSRFLQVGLQRRGGLTSRISLDTLLDNYFKRETVTDFFCENCKKKGEIIKKEEIIKFPETLVVNLKRFEFFSFERKLENRVGILEEIDLGRFFVGCEGLGKESSAFVKKSRKKGRYRLKSFIEHTGRINHGHYVSYCFEEKLGVWLLFNDKRVSIPIDDNFFEGCDVGVYMLFYERIG